MKKQISENLIKKTRDDYNKIAHHFASTRKKALWPDVLKSFEILAPTSGSKILDLGSGSGRLYQVAEKYELDYQGVDLSDQLVEIAKQDFPNGKFKTGDITSLDVENNSFDYIASIAALYHIPSRELRQKALNEIYRILKPNGQAYISIWYFWNKDFFWEIILKKILKLQLHDLFDFYLPWKSPSGEVITNRYCHPWTAFELKSKLKRAGFKKIRIIRSSGKIGHNLNVIVYK